MLFQIGIEKNERNYIVACEFVCVCVWCSKQQQGWSGNVPEEQWLFFSFLLLCLLLHLLCPMHAVQCYRFVCFFPFPATHKCSYQVRWQNKAKQIGIQWLTRVHCAPRSNSNSNNNKHSSSNSLPSRPLYLAQTEAMRECVCVCASFVKWIRSSSPSTIPSHLSTSMYDYYIC